MALTEEHAAARMKGIGGSELATILHKEIAESGDTVYGCPLALFFEKTGVEADYPFPELGIIRRGEVLEPIIADLYHEESGHKIRTLPHKVSKTNSWEMVSIDRQIVGVEPGPGILECKSVGQNVWYQIKAKGNPLRYVLQVLWGMHILGKQYTWGRIAFLWADGWEYHSFPVERDQDLINMVARKVSAFWQQVLAKTPPKKLKYKDPRCQKCRWGPTCQGAERLKAAGAEIESFEEIEVDEALGPKVLLRQELKGIENDAKVQRTEVEGEIIEGMGGREIIVAGGHRVVHKKKDGGFIVDTPRMRKDAPEVFEEWKKPKADSHPLNFYPV
ncbi:MAG TPA: hypothetical protein ENI27_06080 [bacterium]|nr:hypothetical protein [bacterium]